MLSSPRRSGGVLARVQVYVSSLARSASPRCLAVLLSLWLLACVAGVAVWQPKHWLPEPGAGPSDTVQSRLTDGDELALINVLDARDERNMLRASSADLDSSAALQFEAAQVLLRAALIALSRPHLSPNFPSYWQLLRLRARTQRTADARTLELIEASWTAALSEEERAGEWDLWANSFEPAEEYSVRHTDLFPAPYAPDLRTHDTAGTLITVSGRYRDDEPRAPAAAHPSLSAEDAALPFSFHYKLCTFQHVCLSAEEPGALFMHFSNYETYMHYARVMERCAEGERLHGDTVARRAVSPGDAQQDEADDEEIALCACFHQFFRPRLRAYEFAPPEDAASAEADSRRASDASIPPSSAPVRVLPDLLAHVPPIHSHVWCAEKYVSVHHLAHWVQKLMTWQSLMQHAHAFYEPSYNSRIRLSLSNGMQSSSDSSDSPFSSLLLPAFTALLFPDTDSMTSEHEEAILATVLEAAMGNKSHARTTRVRREEAAHKDVDESRGSPFASPGGSMPPFLSRPRWFDDSGSVVWLDDVRSRKYAVRVRARNPSHQSSPQQHGRRPFLSSSSSSSPSDFTATPYTCFRRLTFTPTFGKVALHPKDTRRFRLIAHRHMHARVALEKMKGEVDIHARKVYESRSSDENFISSLASSPVLLSPAAASSGADDAFSSVAVSRSSPPPAPTSCPPRVVRVLYRHNRRLLNHEALMAMLERKFNTTWMPAPEWEKASLEFVRIHRIPPPENSIPMQMKANRTRVQVAADNKRSAALQQLDYTTLSAGTSSLDQSLLFSSAGLLLSTHSSQLLNMLFSPSPQAAIVEITPLFHNANFATYAWGLGIENYHYFLGGSAMLSPNSSVPLQAAASMVECVRALNVACPTGEGACVLQEWRKVCPDHPLPPRQPSKLHKDADFRVIDLERLERVLDVAIAQLDEACAAEGGWLAQFASDREKHQARQQQQQGRRKQALT